MLRLVLQLYCIISLLLAQQAALTHAAWHIHDAGHAQHHSDDDHNDGRGPALCHLDLAYCEVLGGVHRAALSVHAVAGCAPRAPGSHAVRSSAEPVPTRSRDPPGRSHAAA